MVTAAARRWRRRKAETGSVAPKPHVGGNPARVQGDEKERVRRLVAEHPDWSIDKVPEAWSQAAHARTSRSSMGRTLQVMGLTRKNSPDGRRAGQAPRPGTPRALQGGSHLRGARAACVHRRVEQPHRHDIRVGAGASRRARARHHAEKPRHGHDDDWRDGRAGAQAP